MNKITNEIMPTEHQQKYYRWGQEARAEIGEEYSFRLAMGELSGRDQKWEERIDLVSESADQPFFKAGFNGSEPEWVQAVRFGEIPESGRSTNWATGETEYGVSTVYIIREGVAQDPCIYDVIYGAQDIDKIVIEGWYLGFSGADGEPLLHFAKKVGKFKSTKK